MVLLKFLFETLTDLSVVPSLFLIWQRCVGRALCVP